MDIVRIDDAPTYEAPGHQGFHMRRLQGMEASPASAMWVGLSIIAPGGQTTLTASHLEKIYVVIAGEVVLGNGAERARLGPLDSCRIAPGEPRQVSNEGATEARLLLAMPLDRVET